MMSIDYLKNFSGICNFHIITSIKMPIPPIKPVRGLLAESNKFVVEIS